MNDFIEKLCGKPKNLFVYKIAAHKERLQRVPTHQPFHAHRPLVGKGMTKKALNFALLWTQRLELLKRQSGESSCSGMCPAVDIGLTLP